MWWFGYISSGDTLFDIKCVKFDNNFNSLSNEYDNLHIILIHELMNNDILYNSSEYSDIKNIKDYKFYSAIKWAIYMI